MFISSCCGILIPEFCSIRFQTLEIISTKGYISRISSAFLMACTWLSRFWLDSGWPCYEHVMSWAGHHHHHSDAEVFMRDNCVQPLTHCLVINHMCCAAGQLVQRSQSINEINKQSPAPAPHCTLTSTSLWILLPGLDPFIAFSNGSILLSDQGLTLLMLFIRSTSWLGLSKFYQRP